MEKIPDWLKIWSELVEIRNTHFALQEEGQSDHWSENARKFSDRVRERWQEPDTSRDFLKSVLFKNPESTLLDIGAGTGNWAIYLSPYAKRITALEPSAGMRAVLEENLMLSKPKVNNVTIMMGKWPETDVPEHDFSLCSHAMYGIPNFGEAVRKMNDITRKSCFLLIRAPLTNDPLAQIAQKVWGQPNDSPNFTIAYNALIQMGIYANVLFEENRSIHPKVYPSYESAFSDIKSRFGLENDSQFDTFIRSVLIDHLVQSENRWILQHNVKVGLISWNSIR